MAHFVLKYAAPGQSHAVRWDPHKHRVKPGKHRLMFKNDTNVDVQVSFDDRLGASPDPLTVPAGGEMALDIDTKIEDEYQGDTVVMQSLKHTKAAKPTGIAQMAYTGGSEVMMSAARVGEDEAVEGDPVIIIQQ